MATCPKGECIGSYLYVTCNEWNRRYEPVETEHPVFAFLLGEGDLEGCWFGESGRRKAPFWWRKHLRAALIHLHESATLKRVNEDGARACIEESLKKFPAMDHLRLFATSGIFNSLRKHGHLGFAQPLSGEMRERLVEGMAGAIVDGLDDAELFDGIHKKPERCIVKSDGDFLDCDMLASAALQHIEQNHTISMKGNSDGQHYMVSRTASAYSCDGAEGG